MESGKSPLQNPTPVPPLHPRIATIRRADMSAVTSNDPAQPRRLEKKTNTPQDCATEMPEA